jgi:hypothetical protein
MNTIKGVKNQHNFVPPGFNEIVVPREVFVVIRIVDHVVGVDVVPVPAGHPIVVLVPLSVMDLSVPTPLMWPVNFPKM